MLMICPDPSIEVPAEEDDYGAWNEELDRRSARVIGGRLRPRDASTTVSVRASLLTVTDGPFAEAKEVFAGFEVVECGNLDDAIKVASKHPVANHGSIEIRPFWPFDDPEDR